MKRQLGLLVGLLLAGSATAAVYKWVDDRGNVHYGDLPPDQAPAEPLKLPGLSTYKNRAIPKTEPTGPQQPSVFDGYTKVDIVQPAAGSAVRANDQKVTVVVALEPALQTGHRVSFELDGQAVGEPQPGLSVTLTGVYRGAHRLQAKVVDATGKPVGESAVTEFTLRQVSSIKPTPIPNPPPPPPPPPSSPPPASVP